MSSLGKRNRDDDDDNNEDDDLDIKAPPPKKRRTCESNKNQSNNSLSGLSSHPITAVNKVIVLNVGGVKYTTTLSTLTGYESMLKARFSGNYSMETMDDGSYFFDRDGNLFQYILEYLRTGKLRIPEKWTKTELCSFNDEVEYFAVTSLLDLLHLKFFESKILTHDAMKQRLLSKMREIAKSYIYPRNILPTNDKELQFEYNRSTETQRERKKHQIAEIMNQGQLVLLLVLADGKIYGRLRPYHLSGKQWVHKKVDKILTFCWPSAPNLCNADDPCKGNELKFDELRKACYMSEVGEERYKASLHDSWVTTMLPYVIAAVVDCDWGDFTIKDVNDADSMEDVVQKMQVWIIPSSRCSV